MNVPRHLQAGEIIVDRYAWAKDAWTSFRLHDGRLLSGAAAFHALLAVAPFGVIGLAVAGSIMGEERARSELHADLAVALGEATASRVTTQLYELLRGGSGAWATLLSAAIAFIATVRFVHVLQVGLNHVWGVRPRYPAAFFGPGLRVLRKRLVAFAMVVGFGFALLALLLFKVALAVVAAAVGGIATFYHLVELFASISLLTLLLWSVYRWLPDARIASRDILPGAGVVAVLAVGGSFLFGYYLTNFAPLSYFGVMGTAIALLLWFFYTAQIFFFGAAMIGVWARHRGQGIKPLPHAAQLTVEERQTIVD